MEDSKPEAQKQKSDFRLIDTDVVEQAPTELRSSELPAPADHDEDKEQSKKETRNFVRLTKQEKTASFIRFVSVPAVYWILQYLAAPGFLVPFLNHPLMRTLGLGMLIWLLIGAAIYCQTRGRWSKVLLVTIFMLPCFTWLMLGPAVMTIVSAVLPEIANTLFGR